MRKSTTPMVKGISDSQTNMLRVKFKGKAQRKTNAGNTDSFVSPQNNSTESEVASSVPTCKVTRLKVLPKSKQ